VIVDAAIRVFSRHGFGDASIQDIAREAGVAPTAVYYHFTGKPDLFDAAVGSVLTSITELVVSTRADEDPAGPDELEVVITAVWDWLDAHPDACQLLYHHLPGMTVRARSLQREFEDFHARRAFDYLPNRAVPTTRRSAISRNAAEKMTVRSLTSLLILIHSMRGQDGPLARRPDARVRAALIDVSRRLLGADVA
jgi:AcrR family transcriptional regulator